jgi:hypothetical protein
MFSRSAAMWLRRINGYCLSLGSVHHLQPIAAKAYNDLCSSQGITFPEGYSVLQLGMAAIVLALPALLVGSRVAIAINVLVGLATLYVAMTLFRHGGEYAVRMLHG